LQQAEQPVAKEAAAVAMSVERHESAMALLGSAARNAPTIGVQES
jgi:hypothetical protein